MDETLAGRVPLADMIEALRAELHDAISRSQTETIRFGVEKLDVELSVEVSRSAEGKGGIKFWVVSAEAGAKAASTQIHKVHVTLLPVGADGKAITVSEKTLTEPR